MKCNLFSLLLMLVSVVLFSSCEKEYSFEGGGIIGGDAAYSLAGSPANCGGFLLGGTYVAAVPLTASNVVSVDVNVTAPGFYSITTGVVNGISFSSSGQFTSTGTQSITLSGSGTPVAGGTFTFPLSTDSSTCSFSLTILPPAPPAVATISCAGISTSGTYTSGVALTSSNTLTLPVTVTTAGTYSVSSNINGTTFSGSGVLATGTQTIVLTGTGTPAASGTVTASVALGSSSCTYSIDYQAGTTPPSDFLRCNIDGSARTFNIGLQGSSNTLGTGNVFVIDGDENNTANTPSLTFTLTNLLGTVDAGAYNLISITVPSSQFCAPLYFDGTDTWGPAAAGQSGIFTINVTAKTANRITGTFSGTMYSQSGTGTDAKNFTIGQFSVPY